MKIIIAPDKFKGSLTTFEACESMEAGVRQVDNNIEVEKYPMADGGDGFGAVLQYYLKTETISCAATDPLGRNIAASYQWNDSSKTAIVELAVASGIVLLRKEELNPLVTSTFGTGLVIKHAIEKGAKKIILGLGGSATNDAGTGILAALGFEFRDEKEITLAPVGENLSKITEIITPEVLPSVQFEIACDVQNPLFGENGAAHIYAPQKGATAEQVEILDNGLRNFADVLKRQTGKDIAQIAGTGAAGGIAASLMCFFPVQMVEGASLIMKVSGIEEALIGADILITGEGCIDNQTSDGKIVGQLAALAKSNDVKAIGICGTLQADQEAILKSGLIFATSISNGDMSKEECMANAKALLQEKTAQVVKIFSTMI